MNKNLYALVPIVCLYIFMFFMFLFMILGIGNTYKTLETKRVETMNERMSEILNQKANQQELNSKFTEIVNELSMELIVVNANEETIFSTFPGVEIKSIRDIFNNESILYKSQGIVNTINGDFSVMIVLYHVSLIEYLNQQFIWLTIYITVLFVLLIIIVNFVNRMLFVPLKNIRKAIHEMKDFDATIIEEESVIESEFKEFVDHFDETLQSVSKQYTDLELLLLFEKQRLDFLLKISRASLHELKTPLYQVLLQNKDFLSETTDNTEMIEYNIQKNDALLSRINELLNSISINVNNLENNQELFDGMELFYLVESDFEKLVEQKAIDLVLSTTEDTMIYQNRFALQLIYHNILSNAIKYTPIESDIIFEVNVEKDVIEIICKNEAKIEDIERLRSNRFTIDQTDKMYSSGNGVYLVKEIVKSLNGKTNIEISENTVKVQVSIPNNKNR